MTKQNSIRVGLNELRSAIVIRSRIRELYQQYHAMADVAKFAVGIERHDFKRAVDAIHYLGGGWPSAGSKGRMEAALDNFVGMYRILDFIGRGALVEDHLKKLGINVSIDSAFALKNAKVRPDDLVFLNRQYNTEALGITEPKDMRSLVTQLVDVCDMLQGDICKLADSIKDELRPNAMEKLGVTDEEYDRLHDVVKYTMAGTDKSEVKADKVKLRTSESVSAFNHALGFVRDVSPE